MLFFISLSSLHNYEILQARIGGKADAEKEITLAHVIANFDKSPSGIWFREDKGSSFPTLIRALSGPLIGLPRSIGTAHQINWSTNWDLG